MGAHLQDRSESRVVIGGRVPLDRWDRYRVPDRVPARPPLVTTSTLDPNVLWLRTLAWNAAAHPTTTTTFIEIGTAIHASSTPGPSSCSTPATTDLPTIAACIKACESGNYAESSHPGDGSGAYQFIPGTWRHYFRLWADATGWTGPDFAYAFQAPPEVQDAVMRYAVEHGGAHNWSPKFGRDPCTVNLP